jgi:drug/metabolite transporter (DMT)-like permease
MVTPDKMHGPTMIVGIVCGTLAAFMWAAGFVVAKHGIQVGFSPADLAFHRFFWSGLLMLPYIVHDGLHDLDGVGWGRGLTMSILSGRHNHCWHTALSSLCRWATAPRSSRRARRCPD